MDTTRPGLAAAIISAVLAVGPAGLAAADGDDESDVARELVQQSIGLIVNTPDDVHEIEERIEHALEAPHTEGVELDLVEQAMDALEGDGLQRARELLQAAISGEASGQEPGEHEGDEHEGDIVDEPGRPALAVGIETGTTVVLDEYRPDTALDGGDVALLVFSVAGVALGAGLAWYFRPVDTVHRLRQSARAQHRGE